MFSSVNLFLALGLLSSAAFAGDAMVELEDAWVRALPPTQSNTAAYLTIHNKGPEPVTINAASVERVGRVEFHTTREVDGYMRMEQLPALVVGPGEREVLSPGGTHLMLLDLESMPVEGDSVKLCVTLASSEQVCTDAPVRKSAESNEHHHHH